MKNHFLKHFFWLLLIVLIASCSKNDPEPDAASLVVGEYKITEVVANGLTVTEAMIDQLKGVATITLTRREANKVNFKFYTNLNGQITNQQADVLLEKSGSVVLFKDGTLKIGQYQEGKIELTFSDPSNNSPVVMKAKRK